MQRLAAIALILAVALLVASDPSVGSSSPSSTPTLSTEGTWTFRGLDPVERLNFAADIASAMPAARQVLDLVDGSIAIDSYANLCVVGDACSHPEPSAGRPWTIHLPHGTLDGTYMSQRFVVFLEIGHAVWSRAFRQLDRDAFAQAWSDRLGGRPCATWDGDPCAPIHEIFADEFARWVGNFEVCMDAYRTPALISDAAFGTIVDRALAARV